MNCAIVKVCNAPAVSGHATLPVPSANVPFSKIDVTCEVMTCAVVSTAYTPLRAGVPVGEKSDLFVDFANVADKNYRGIGWGMDGAGRSITLKWRMRF